MKLFRTRSRTVRAEQALRRARSGIDDIIARIEDAGDQAAEGLVTAGAKLRRAEQKVVDASRSYVRENPFKSTAITLALGAMAATLFMAARRRY